MNNTGTDISVAPLQRTRSDSGIPEEQQEACVHIGPPSFEGEEPFRLSHEPTPLAEEEEEEELYQQLQFQ
jgi:hypothetical protein